MAWLPGQTLAGSGVDVANPQSSPSRFTTAAHIRVPLNKPPTVPPIGPVKPGAALSWFLRSASLGSPLQSAAKALGSRQTANSQPIRILFILIILLTPSRCVAHSSPEPFVRGSNTIPSSPPVGQIGRAH